MSLLPLKTTQNLTFYVLCYWVLFVQAEKREKHPWRSVTFSTNSNTPPWVFLTFFKLYKWYQIAQSVSYFMIHFGTGNYLF